MNFSEVVLIDPLSDGRWDSFVQSHPYGTIYQHSSWIKVLTLTYKHIKPLCFALEDQERNIRAAISCFIVKSRLTGTRIVSLPFTSYCDPLVDDNKDLIKLLNRVIKEVENTSASYYELRPFWNRDLIEDDRLKSHNCHKIHILDIKDGFEKVERAFPRDIVKSKKRAIRSGLTIRQGCCERDLKEFYFMHALMRRRLGFPIQPYLFFKNMWEIMYPKGYFTLILAQWNNRTIAGLILFKFKGIVTYEFGSPIQKHLDKKPNHFLLWNAIELACSEGYHYFDFGKSPSDNKGLLYFKGRWGAKMHDLPYFYYPEIKGMMSLEQDKLKYKLLRSIGRHMPLSLARIVGRIAYHHLG
jgi:lipid II:glycine glycyltransferase (peptidoglycan interpeptide bridge formation enzyme)